jgi:DNA-binding transcriptional ArsR family regulator/uncharacterized protein YndB with AHSA1/START domain
VDDVQRVIDALASPIRREILWRTWRDELLEGDIAAAFGLTAPAASSHLQVLREAGLVRVRSLGNARSYRANQQVLRRVQPLLEPGPQRPRPGSSLPEGHGVSRSRREAIVVVAEVPAARADVFRSVTDARLFSHWLGVPVSIEHGMLACEMDSGARVRGRFETVVGPSFIHLLWDTADGDTPTPGAGLSAYVHFDAIDRGHTRVEVRQLVDDAAQAEFMEVAWSAMLARLRDRVVDALRSEGRRGAPRLEVVRD